MDKIQYLHVCIYPGISRYVLGEVVRVGCYMEQRLELH